MWLQDTKSTIEMYIIRGLWSDKLCAILIVTMRGWFDWDTFERPLLHSVLDRCFRYFVDSVTATNRGSQAVAELVSEGQLDVSGRQELSVVLYCDHTCVQGGVPAVTQGGLLWTDSSPVTWSEHR